MNLHEFLSHPDIQVPLSWDGTDDFQGFVQERFARFRTRISEVEDCPVIENVRSREPAITKCCDNIVRSIDYSLNGCLREAFDKLSDAVQAVQDELSRQKSEWNIDPKWDTFNRFFYRVRRATVPRLKRGELFHIPFEKRHEVPPYRYSIPGLPCLYLAGSLYTCWEEMQRPPFHELQVAALWLKDAASILHLNGRPSEFLNWVEGNDVIEPRNPSLKQDWLRGWVARCLVLWPLIASSSIVVKNRDAHFKPEYLVPQMLLQWVRRGGEYDGICYSSTHIRAISREYPLAICNYAFPAKHSQVNGHCNDLCNLFKMTRPCGWQLLRAAQVGDGPAVVAAMFRFELVENMEEQYAYSEFGEIESKLRKLADVIKRKNNNGQPEAGDITDDN